MVRGLHATLFLLLLFGCQPVGEEALQQRSEGRVPAQESWNSSILISSTGHRNVEARGAYLAQYEDPREILFIGDVTLDFYDETGAHSSTMQADTGRIADEMRMFTATGAVMVESDSGMTLTTTLLHWNEQREKIYTDAPIKLTSPTDTLYGIGFESDAALEKWIIHTPTGVTYRELDP